MGLSGTLRKKPTLFEEKGGAGETRAGLIPTYKNRILGLSTEGDWFLLQRIDSWIGLCTCITTHNSQNMRYIPALGDRVDSQIRWCGNRFCAGRERPEISHLARSLAWVGGQSLMMLTNSEGGRARYRLTDTCYPSWDPWPMQWWSVFSPKLWWNWWLYIKEYVMR